MSRIVLAAALVLTSTACAKLSTTRARELDAKATLPAGAPPRDRYVRFYVAARVASAEDLPFTTLRDGVRLPARDVVLGLFVLPGQYGVVGPPRVEVVQSVSALPYAVHGGCRAVNVVIDPKTGRTAGSWCNIDQDAPLPPHPEGVPP